MTLRFYRRFTRLNGEPRRIALGFSLGLLIGMTPFFGAQVLSSLVLASLLGWSKVAAVVGVNITNVITIPLIYPINYWVGLRLVGASRGIQWPETFDIHQFAGLMKHSPLVLADLCIGGVVLGTPLAVAGYFIVLKVVRLYRERSPLPVSDQYSR